MDKITADFMHQLYPQSLGAATWRGIKISKTPLDLWVYQELICRVRPDWLIETGSRWGGSACYFADVMALLRHGMVISVEARNMDLPAHERVHWLHGYSTTAAVVERVANLVAGAGTVLVSLDSAHRKRHVLAELDLYAPLVTPGSYLVVEDTAINGHPVKPDFGPGPAEALAEWLPQHPEFRADRKCEKWLATYNPGGWLQRRV